VARQGTAKHGKANLIRVVVVVVGSSSVGGSLTNIITSGSN
jgi:hypothetical protein